MCKYSTTSTELYDRVSRTGNLEVETGGKADVDKKGPTILQKKSRKLSTRGRHKG